eukprot:358363-Chlamydomonas_euryale.AAC.2
MGRSTAVANACELIRASKLRPLVTYEGTGHGGRLVLLKVCTKVSGSLGQRQKMPLHGASSELVGVAPMHRVVRYILVWCGTSWCGAVHPGVVRARLGEIYRDWVYAMNTPIYFDAVENGTASPELLEQEMHLPPNSTLMISDVDNQQHVENGHSRPLKHGDSSRSSRQISSR